MKLKIKRGTTDKIIRVFIQDASKSDGGLKDLVYNSPGLTVSYIREGDGSTQDITLQAGTIGSYISSGFVEVDSVKMPGIYELSLPNAALSSGASTIIYISGAVNMVTTIIEIELDAVDYQNTKLGITNMTIDMAQSVPTDNQIQTLGEALNGSLVQAFGTWIKNDVTLSLYNRDGTLAHTFTLDNATTPSSRTIDT